MTQLLKYLFKRKISFVTALVCVFTFGNAIGLAAEDSTDTTETIQGTETGGSALVLSGSGTSAAQGIVPDQFTGAASYSLTIPVPPGRAGLQPNIMLSYGSHRRDPNSWVGSGWSLDWGAIARLPEDGVINYTSGKSFEAQFGGQSETLQLKKSKALPADYGLDLPAGVVVDEYEAKVASGFNIFLHARSYTTTGSLAADHGFIVIDKSGRRFTFGSHDNARVGYYQFIAKWLLVKVEDPNGNEVLVNYSELKVPTSIVYGDITIKFETQKSQPYFPAYRNGILAASQISTLHSMTINQDDDRLQKFEFDYNADVMNAVPYLYRMTQRGKTDSETLPPTTFTYYTNGGVSWLSTTDYDYQASRNHKGEYQQGWINVTTEIVDMNGDGLVDQIVGFPESQDFMVYYNDGSNFVEKLGQSLWQEPFTDCNACGGKINNFKLMDDGRQFYWLQLIDMNGDSLPDRVVKHEDENGKYFKIAFNNGKTWDKIELWKDPEQGNWGGYSTSLHALIDMNGDGLVDRVISEAGDADFRVHLGTGKGFEDEPKMWTDPYSEYVANDSSKKGRIFMNSKEGRLIVFVRDLNGDGLPDRIWRESVLAADGKTYVGFFVALNLNGKAWAKPVLTGTKAGQVSSDGINTLFLKDPISEKKLQGYVSKRTDLMDINGDGYLDRIHGDEAAGEFNIYYFNGLAGSETIDFFSETPKVMKDPVADVSGEWQAQGNLTVNKGGTTKVHTFFRDINGDGYVDRVTLKPGNSKENNKTYHVHPLVTVPLADSDIPAGLAFQKINQPLGALSSITDGSGLKSAIEYIPTTIQISALKQRFLPFNLHVVHKIYALDLNMTKAAQTEANALPEGQRHPRMRWITYHYQGGSFYLRYANPEKGKKRYSRFNGFQKVWSAPLHLAADAWEPYYTITKFHQAESEDPFMAAPYLATFDEAGYTHFALSGRPYLEEVVQNGHIVSKQESLWFADKADVVDGYSCDGSCYPQLVEQLKTVAESPGATPRISKVGYNYDAMGNVLVETHYKGGTNEKLLTTETSYYSTSDFPKIPFLRDRVQTQLQIKDNTVFRKKSFAYDEKGNPDNESFLLKATEEIAITRIFDDYGNLKQITELDGIVKKYKYDPNHLFPVEEDVYLQGGDSLTTERAFNRLNGEVTKEVGPHGVGREVVYDDFGRTLEEYVISATSGKQLVRKYDYEFVTIDTSTDGTPLQLLKTTVWEPQPDYAATNTEPAQISYADSGGNVFQQCVRAENGKYRRVQYRMEEGGRQSYSTDPLSMADCNYANAVDNNLKKYFAKKDFMGRMVMHEPPPGDAASPVEEVSFAYATTKDGFLKKETFYPNKQKRTEVFDHTERLMELKDTDNQAVEYKFNAVGDLVEVKTAGQSMTVIEYDLLGRKTKMWDANLGTWKYAYDENGLLTKQTDNKGQAIEYTYTTLNRVSTKIVRGADGKIEGSEEYFYDVGSSGYDVKKGELYEVVEKDGTGKVLRQTRFGYDADYRRVSKLSRTIPDLGWLHQTLTHDYRGNITATTYPTGESVYYTYNRNGGLEKICANASCDAANGQVYYAIDPTNGYTDFGALQRETFGNGVMSDYTYYPNSKRPNIKKTYIGSNVHAHKEYEYDANANIKKINDVLNRPGTGAISIANYDSENRLTGYQYQNTDKPQALTYDVFGNITKNTASFGENKYEYTSAKPHAVTKIGDRTFTYDDNGNMTADGERKLYYNGKNELSKVEMNNGNVIEYFYDYTGARVAKKVTVKDALQKLHVHTTHFLGEVLQIKDDRIIMHINAGGRKIATKSLGKVNDGFAGGSGVIRNTNMDLELTPTMLMPYGMLFCVLLFIAALRPIRAPPLLPEAERQRGREAEKKRTHVRTLLNAWSVITRSLHEALNRIHQNTAPKFISLILTFLFVVQFPLMAMADHTNEPIIPVSDEDFLYYHHDDHLGSSHVLTEGKDKGYHSGVTYNKGDLLQRFEYEPFGREKYVLNPNLNIDPSYTGQTYDVESGLYYYHARYYDPTLGRFIQPDTIVPDAKNLQAFNRYSYVVNNPFKYTDPSGHGALDWFKKIFGAFIAALVAVVAAFIVSSAPGFVAALGKVGSKVVAGTVGGLIGGALGGAITGGHMGALMGLTFGAAGGALAGLGSAGLSEIGVKTFWGQFAVMSGVGAALSGGLGGWEGLVTFGAGALGALAGMGITGGIRAPPRAGASASAEAEEELNLYADVSSTDGANDYVLRNELGGGGGGHSIYRQGNFPSNKWEGNYTKGGQWSPKHPLTVPDFPKKYGLPLENSGTADWIIKGNIRGTYTSGPAPPSYNNPLNIGGATEIRPTNPGKVKLDWFHMQ